METLNARKIFKKHGEEMKNLGNLFRERNEFLKRFNDKTSPQVTNFLNVIDPKILASANKINSLISQQDMDTLANAAATREVTRGVTLAALTGVGIVATISNVIDTNLLGLALGITGTVTGGIALYLNFKFNLYDLLANSVTLAMGIVKQGKVPDGS